MSTILIKEVTYLRNNQAVLWTRIEPTANPTTYPLDQLAVHCAYPQKMARLSWRVNAYISTCVFVGVLSHPSC